MASLHICHASLFTVPSGSLRFSIWLYSLTLFSNLVGESITLIVDTLVLTSTPLAFSFKNLQSASLLFCKVIPSLFIPLINSFSNELISLSNSSRLFSTSLMWETYWRHKILICVFPTSHHWAKLSKQSVLSLHKFQKVGSDWQNALPWTKCTLNCDDLSNDPSNQQVSLLLW